MFVIENDIPGKDMLSGHVFGVCQLFICIMYIFTRHGHRHNARDLIEYPWSVLKLSVSLTGGIVTLLITLANSLDSDQARNFDKVSNCLKL